MSLADRASDLYWYAVTESDGVDVRVNETGDSTYDTVTDVATIVNRSTGGDVTYALPGDSAETGNDNTANYSAQHTGTGTDLDVSYPRTMLATVYISADPGTKDLNAFGACFDQYDFAELTVRTYNWNYLLRTDAQTPVEVKTSTTGDNRPGYNTAQFFTIAMRSASATDHVLTVYSITDDETEEVTSSTSVAEPVTDIPNFIMYSCAHSDLEVLQVAWYTADLSDAEVDEFEADPYSYLDATAASSIAPLSYHHYQRNLK